jgi:hypothetical protein
VWSVRGIGKVALTAVGVCLAAGLACKRRDPGEPALQPLVTRADAKPAAPGAPDAGAGTDIAAAIAAGTWCFSNLNLEIPKTASRQMEQIVQRCAAAVPAQKGLVAAHLRIRIEANGRVRDVQPFDAQTEPIAGAVLACIQTAAREWTVPHGKKQCIEVGPKFELLPLDIVIPGYHHRDDLRTDFKTGSWWALCQEDETLVPRRVRLSANRVRDDSCFHGDGRDVKVLGCEKPLFVTKALPMPTKQLQLASLARDQDPPDERGGWEWSYLSWATSQAFERREAGRMGRRRRWLVCQQCAPCSSRVSGRWDPPAASSWRDAISARWCFPRPM